MVIENKVIAYLEKQKNSKSEYEYDELRKSDSFKIFSKNIIVFLHVPKFTHRYKQNLITPIIKKWCFNSI